MICVDAVARVREYVLANQDVYRDTTKYILGGGWDHTFWPRGGWPSAVRLGVSADGAFAYVLFS